MKYYSQQDPNWKYLKLGNSNLTVANYGCLTCVICTLASWFGDVITPRVMAKTAFCYTPAAYGKKQGLVIWGKLKDLFQKIKFQYRYYSFNENIIDECLIKNPNTAVILNVDKGYHWVAALGKTSTGYRCLDPYPYPAKIRVYRKSEIVGFGVIIKK